MAPRPFPPQDRQLYHLLSDRRTFPLGCKLVAMEVMVDTFQERGQLFGSELPRRCDVCS